MKKKKKQKQKQKKLTPTRKEQINIALDKFKKNN